jgi:dienelactone hydrolase
MSSDQQFFLTLQRGLLACALTLSAVLPGCGEDVPDNSLPEATADDEGEPASTDDTSADDGDDSDDTSVKPSIDAGKKDAGQKDAGKPVIDAGTDAAKPDAGGAKTDSGPGVVDADSGGSDGASTSGPTGGVSEPDEPTTASASAMGKFTVKTYTSGYPDSPDYADSTMHYPEGVDGPLPSMAIVPGFASPQSSIQKWGPFLASHGIITLTIGTNSTGDQPPARAKALWGAIATIKGENTREGSPLKGKVDVERMAIGGWSMGGGGTLIGIQDHPELKAAIALCPWNPGATFPKITTPILFIAGLNDELAAGQSQPFYESIPESTPKMLWERASADHFVNDPDYDMGAQGRYGLSWLKVFLEGDQRYKQFLLEMPPDISDFKTNVK